MAARRRRCPTTVSHEGEAPSGSMDEFLEQPICSEFLIEKFLKSCIHTPGSDSLLIWVSLTIARGRVAIISRDWNILISQQPVCLLKTPSEILKPAQSRAGAGIVSVGWGTSFRPPKTQWAGTWHGTLVNSPVFCITWLTRYVWQHRPHSRTVQLFLVLFCFV